MRSLRPPSFLVDLLRDLRDRRLALPALALIVGLVAVPTLLARSTDAPPPPPPAAATGAASPTEAAVLAESELGVRDYRERLERLKSKNPFAQQFPLPDVSNSDDLDVTTEDPTLDTGGAASSPAPSEGPVDVSVEDPVVEGGSSSGEGGTGSPQPPRVDPRYFTYRVDVRVGPVGAAVARDGVKQLSPLPSSSKPVVVFLGVTEDGKRAIFAVSRDVTAVTGTGKCLPGPSNCAYVAMEEGEQSVFEYAPDGVSYRLTLREIRRSQVKEPGKLDGTS